MDNVSAINILRDCEGSVVMDEEYRETYNMAIEALEKQIPKDVRLTVSKIKCPICGKTLTSKGAIHADYHYCKWCGQAIKW